VAFFGGVFNKTELAWSVPEKEVVAQVRTVQKAQHLVDRPQPFFALVDALAMVKVAEMGDTAASEANHVRAGRIQRWAAFLSKFNAIVVHIPGELNFVADYASRHVAPAAQGEDALAEGGALQADKGATAPEVNNNEAASKSGDESDSDSEAEPETGDAKPDTVADLYDYQKARVTPLDWPAYKWPSTQELVEAQQAALDGKDTPGVDLEQVPDNLRKYAEDNIAPGTQPVINGRATTKDNNGLIRVDGRVWVPARRLDLHAKLCVAAHAGAACHRGRDATYADLKSWFYWRRQRDWVAGFVARCVHCRATAPQGQIARPLASTLQATAPGQILMFDFVHVAGVERKPTAPTVNATAGKSKAKASKPKASKPKTGKPTRKTKGKPKDKPDKAVDTATSGYCKYMLVIRDQLSRRVLLYPCTAADSANAFDGIMAWIKEHGLPAALYSDTASHFTSSLVQQLEDAFAMEHLFAVPYSPWTNGAVERAGGVALELLRAVCSERRLEGHLWYLALGVVQHAMNAAPLKALGGRSPLQVWNGGRPARRPLDVVVGRDELDINPRVQVDAAELARLAAELGDAQYDSMLDSVRETARRVEAQERERADRGKRKRALRLKPGDYVMVARKTRTSTKMEARWTGPHQVIQCHSAHRFTIRHTVTGKETVEHASFLEYYDAEIASTGEQLKAQVAHDTYGFKVSGLGDHGQRDGRWFVLPLWKGFEDKTSEHVWQDLDDVFAGIPVVVKRYLKRLLKSKDAATIKAGREMCAQLGLDPEVVAGAEPAE
jgi:hypothetical protein